MGYNTDDYTKTKWIAIGWGIAAVSAAVVICFWVWCAYAYQKPVDDTQFQRLSKSVLSLEQRLNVLEKFAQSLRITIETKPKAGIGE